MKQFYRARKIWGQGLFIICYFVLSFKASAQAPMTVETVALNQYSTEYALVYTPSGYNPAKKYPLLMFYHGTGESGTTVADLGKLFNNQNAGGPAYYIAHNQWPDSFYNYKDGQYYQFIVVEPQSSGWEPIDQNYTLASIISKYSIDTTRIYLTGLSAGGWTTWNYSAHYQVTPNYKAAAIVPMSMATNATTTDAQYIVGDSIRMWGFGDVSGDSWGLQTEHGAEYMNALVPGIARFTNTIGTGHGGWGNHYIPTYKEDIDGHSLNIYEWMLLWKRGDMTSQAPPINTPPIANPGSDTTLTLPLDSIQLNGNGSSDPDGNINSYQWTQISGPAAASILSPMASSTEVTGLLEGDYVFQLMVIDNAGASDSGQLKITVNPSISLNQPPIAIAGDNQSITLPETTLPVDGSQSYDPDGTTLLYQWTEKSGPSSYKIESPTNAKTNISGLVDGAYVFTLTITDDKGATSTS
ncbi:MAG TPA: hypothetical protein VHA52_09285, partial [Candidatus Babeliaceae bacterium]|nr:hypothetical protein [Candidatus Babeliaceae bacterium]